MRKGAYQKVFTVFRVLFELQELTAETIAVEALKLHETYPGEISKYVIEELLHIRGCAHIEEDKSLDTTNICMWIRDNDLVEVFPNERRDFGANIPIYGCIEFQLGTILLLFEANQDTSEIQYERTKA